MEKGPCFGQCPVYALTIYDNGVASYEGKQFSELQGLYVKRLPKDQLQELKKQLEEANLWRFQDAYRGQLPDLQSVKITYYTDSGVKSIIGKDGRPAEVMNIQKTLEAIAESGHWEAKEEQAKTDLPANIIANQIRVQLMNGVDINAWTRQYSRQGMQIIRSISPNSNYWLVGFDANRNDPKEVLAVVQADIQVVNAEFDRKAGR